MVIQLKRILVPTDFSEPAQLALRYAQSLAESFQASIHLLHVLKDPLMIWVSQSPVPSFVEIRKGMEQNANQQLQQLLTQQEREKFKAELVVKWGSAFVEITRFARESQIDLITMGTHGRGTVAHFFLGSVAENVLRNAPCPVLTVRPSIDSEGQSSP